MRNSISFTLIAASMALSTPVAAQEQPEMTMPEVTMEEGSACMVATIPFMMQAMIFQPENEIEVTGAAEFWANYADSFGEASDAHLAKIEAQTEGMLADLETIETEADMAAFVAPYQAKFDACEELRKALQAG